MACSIRADSSRVLWRLASSSSSAAATSRAAGVAASPSAAAASSPQRQRLIVSASASAARFSSSSARSANVAASPSSLRAPSSCEPLRRSNVASRRTSSASSYPFRLVTRAGWGDPVVWAPATVTRRVPAVPESVLSESPLHSLTLEVGKEAAALYTSPGQYFQVRVGGDEDGTKPGFFAIASAPEPNSSSVDLLVKATGDANNTADALAAASAGTAVQVSPISGRGFAIDKIPASDYHTVLLFATGTGISPIRAAIASVLLNGTGRSAKRRDVRLYYGTRSAAATAFLEEEAQWRAAGVRVIPVYSDEGEDYVQDVFAKELGAQLTSTEGEKGPVFSAALPEGSTGLAEGGRRTAALLCGHRGMCDAVKALLATAGVAPEAVLTNF